MSNISISNAIITPKELNGVLKGYDIRPNDGYVLHDRDGDAEDDNGNRIYRYSHGRCSCGANYDFSTTTLTVPDVKENDVIVTAYGSRQIFAFPESLVPDPENNIYGGGNNNHKEK